jgi:formylglycine-generating enzyme required for sulfatase activity
MTALDLGGTSIELVRLPPGTFLMGSRNELFSEAPPHEVTIAHPFCLGKYPVTQRQWELVTGANPSHFGPSPEHPVDSVSWADASHFCELLSRRCGLTVRLPSEAEWEYACRAGTSAEFFFSGAGPFVDDEAVPHEIRLALRDYAWFHENSGGTTHTVGEKRPNPWGLHDLTGNVWEWCADHWHDGYTGAPADGRPWVEAAPRRPLRCLRGGAWDMNGFRCRSTYRSWDWEQMATSRIGLRICIESPGTPPAREP